MQNTNPTEPIEPCTITYGVDLSTSPRSTGLVAIEWAGGQPGIVVEAHAQVTREDLIERIARSEDEHAVWAVDVPFGWPDGFVDFLASHKAGPTALAPGQGPLRWAAISQRETDRVARQTQRSVVNVGTHDDALAANEHVRDALACALVARAPRPRADKWPNRRSDRTGESRGLDPSPAPRSARRAYSMTPLRRRHSLAYVSSLNQESPRAPSRLPALAEASGTTNVTPRGRGCGTEAGTHLSRPHSHEGPLSLGVRGTRERQGAPSSKPMSAASVRCRRQSQPRSAPASQRP